MLGFRKVRYARIPSSERDIFERYGETIIQLMVAANFAPRAADLRAMYSNDAMIENAVQWLAPGWRDHVGTDMNQEAFRGAIIKYWSDKVMALGLPRAEHCQLIKGPQGQRLYWLMLLARHDLAHQLWMRISSLAKAPEFDF